MAGEGGYDGAPPLGIGVDGVTRPAGILDVQGADVVAILTRAPSTAGKTRLFAALAIQYDPTLPAAMLLDTLDGVSTPHVHRAVAVSPPDAVEEIRALARGCSVIAQAGVTLGDRMRGAMRHYLALGARAVAVVGSDVPTITPAHIASAFAVLVGDPAALVLGPARDGGYYLIAATSVPPVFDGIAWGTAGVFEQTRALAVAAGRPVRVLGPLTDVDGVTDLVDAAVSCPNSRTASWVHRVMPQLIPDPYGRA